jgi:putative ABC transport system permease protein
VSLPRWRRHQEAELDEELQSHLQMAIQDRIDRGQPPDQAAAAARREFGNTLLVKETTRDTWGWAPIQQWSQDIRYAARALAKAPAFTTAAVLTLALGIGANTAMFSVVRAVVLRPLPFADPDRLVQVNELDLRGAAGQRSSVSWPNFADWQRLTTTLESMAAYHTASATITGLGSPQHVPAAVVSATLFATLGVQPASGRDFRVADEQVGAETVIISDKLRRTLLANRSDPVGTSLVVNGRPSTIVGVMPPGFVFPVTSPAPQLWLTTAEDARVESPGDTPIAEQRSAHYLQVVARLRRDTTFEQAQVELNGVAVALASAFPDDNASRGVALTPQLEALIGEAARPLWLLLAAVGCVLLIACVNLANLMTARGVARQAELALRVALGASRSRLTRLLLAEAVTLAAASVACGLLVAQGATGLLVSLAPSDVRGLDAVRIDGAVLAFTAGLGAVCAVLVGIVPALRATGGELRRNLSTSRAETGVRSQQRWLNGLIAAETAVGVLLLVAATQVIDGLGRLARTHPGFDAADVTTLRVNLPDTRYPHARQLAFYDRLLPELAQIPGVLGTGLVGPLPLSGSRYGISFELPGDAATVRAKRPSAGFAFVSPGYFRAMRVPVRQGREFTTADTDASPRVVVINESFARRYFPDVNPIGQRLKPGLSTTEPEAPWREVVGVSADAKQLTLQDDPAPMYFVPYSQGLITTPHVVIRSADAAIAETARRVVAEADPELAVYDVKLLADRLDSSMGTQRFVTWLLALFAALGLLLTAVGIYGLLAYRVGRRRQELGVRMALGASPSNIVAVVLGSALTVVIAGLAVGITTAMALVRVLLATLDFVRPPGAGTIAIVAGVMLLTAVAAALAPVRRALRVDPMQTLRSD